MKTNKRREYLYGFILILTLPAIFKTIGIAEFWFYELPKLLTSILVLITLPIGFYVLVNKIVNWMGWFITTWKNN